MIYGDRVICHDHLGFETLIYHVTLSGKKALVATHLDALERLMYVVYLTVGTNSLPSAANFLL